MPAGEREPLIAFSSEPLVLQIPLVPGNNVDATVTYWNPQVSPALPKNRELEYGFIVRTSGSEEKAISGSRSPAGIAVQLPTLRIELFALAPFGYQFEILEYGAIRADSSIHTSESDRVKKPEFKAHGSVLAWSIPFPLPHIRYQFVYQLKKFT